MPFLSLFHTEMMQVAKIRLHGKLTKLQRILSNSVHSNADIFPVVFFEIQIHKPFKNKWKQIYFLADGN